MKQSSMPNSGAYAAPDIIVLACVCGSLLCESSNTSVSDLEQVDYGEI